MTAYYNEIDEFAAAWLRNLIRDGHIAPGDVDTRSIEDIKPDDLRGYTQCHFFAGVGIWSYALRRAGWDDNRPIWTGSCPCQPFSSAGKGDGFGDERHLWPAFYHLAAQCRPSTICGEQVASKDGYAWLDLVQTDLEGLAYAFWPVVLPIAGVGGPHERHRTFWVGLDDAERVGLRPGRHGNNRCDDGEQLGAVIANGGLADAARGHPAINARHGAGSRDAAGAGAPSGVTGRGTVGGLADHDGEGFGVVGTPHDHGGSVEGGHDAIGCGTNGGLADAQSHAVGPRLSGGFGGGRQDEFTGSGDAGGLVNSASTGRGRDAGEPHGGGGEPPLGVGPTEFGGRGNAGGLVDAAGRRWEQAGGAAAVDHGQATDVLTGAGAANGGVGDAERAGLERHPGNGDGAPGREAAQRSIAPAGVHVGMADAPGGGLRIGGSENIEGGGGYGYGGGTIDEVDRERRPGPLNGFWRNADWLFCTDGKWRPVEPGTRPLAYGLPLSMGTVGPGLGGLCAMAGVDGHSLKRAKAYRVGTLRGYGNAISPEPAIAFIDAWMDLAA